MFKKSEQSSNSLNSLKDSKGNIKDSGSITSSAPGTAPNTTTHTSSSALSNHGSTSNNALNSTSNTTANSNKLYSTGLLMVRVAEAHNLYFPEHIKDPTRLTPYLLIEYDKNESQVPAKSNFSVLSGYSSGINVFSVSWQHRVHFDSSRETDVVLSIYVPRSGIKGEDLLLGSVKIRPNYYDQIVTDESVKLITPYVAPDANIAHPSLHVQTCFKRATKSQTISIDDFELLKVLGKGSFGKVMQVRKKDTNRIYAMKVIKKSHIVERSEVTHTLAERNVLAQINHPFIVPLKFSFQSPEKLYLVLAFVNGGELFYHLQNDGKFLEDRSRLYIAELLTALDCLHSYDIIYRDLKPENILLDYTGHIALCDFGLCKLNMKEGAKTNTFCGTPEYLSPELILGQPYTKTVDWWTLGILLYEMLTGLPPFYDENVNEMYHKIVKSELVFPDYVSPKAKDLLKRLLNRDPDARLGSKGAEEIKSHPFFTEINWDLLMAKKYQPPFKPNVLSATDTSNFDPEFTSEIPTDSVGNGSALSATIQQQFAGFSYQAHEIGSLQNANVQQMSPERPVVDRMNRMSIGPGVLRAPLRKNLSDKNL